MEHPLHPALFLSWRIGNGTGSGIIIDEDGIIITNHHVIKDATKLEVTLADGSKWPAKLLGKAGH